MAKVHKSLRIDAELAERVRGAMADGETETAAYARVIEAGLHAIDGEPQPRLPEQADGALVDALRDHVGTLREQNEALMEQLAVKDGQIEALTRITEQSQALHAITERKGTKAIESRDAKRRGFLSRLFDREAD